MIEVIYKEEKQEAKGNEGMFSVPKNIRQIGLISGNYRIYVEDYVYTFLGKIAGAGKKGETKARLAVLIGEVKWADSITYIFVKGAIEVEETEAASEHIEWTEEIWKKIDQEQELYFRGQEIVGWFFSEPELSLEMTETFSRIHRKYFGGGEKVLMLMEPVEREDAFFRFENNFLVRQSGYYLYYERNPQMQAYMIEKNGGPSTEENKELEDEAVKNFRKMIKNKKPEKKEKKEREEERNSVFSYAATACLAVAVLTVGVNFYHNYQTLQKNRIRSEAVSAEIKEKPVASGEKNKENKDFLKKEENGEKKLPLKETESHLQEDGLEIEQEDADDQDMETKDVKIQNRETEEREEDIELERAEEEDSESLPEQKTEETAEQDSVYREESDVRKAKRREALEKQTEQQKTIEESVETNALGEGVSYVIRPGDSLYQISMEHYGNIDRIEEICRKNGISPNEIIYPGQIIVLP